MMNVLATFGNLLSPESLLIGVVILLLFGAKKLPELARGLGQSLNEFKRAREDFQHELTTSSNEGVSIQAAKDSQPRAGSLSAQELQNKVEELERQLHAAQVRQQTPQLIASSPVTSDVVVEEPIRSTHS